MIESRTTAIDWMAVTIFFGVAVIWSALFAHLDALALPRSVGGMPIDDSILIGFGPAVGALIALLVRPKPSIPPLMGPHRWFVLAAMAAPAMTYAIWSVRSDGMAASAIFALSVTLYCVGEELGWRGWLHGALGGLTRAKSALLTAALWFAWHWSFLADQLANPVFAAQFAVGLLLGSFGLAAAVDRTLAIGIAIAWHTAVKTLGPTAQIATMIAVIALATWAARAVSKPDRPMDSPVAL